MNIKALFAGGLLAVSAGASMAQSLDPVRIEMFRSILAGNECTLTEAAASNILPRFDFTRDETRAIVGALVAAGEVQLDGNTLMLVDGSCAVEDPVVALLERPDVQQFIAVMSENGCEMNEADAEQIFAARGINKAQVGAVIGPMIGAEMATFEAGVLSVGSAYCSAPVVAQETAPIVGSPVETAAETVELDRSGMFGMGRVRELVDVMAANGCTLNMDAPDAFLAEAGIEHSFATFVARKMVSDGFASMVDAQNMQLPAPYCVSAGGAPVEAVTAATPGVDMNMVASLREIFLANSCRLTEDQMDEFLPPAGFTRDNIKPVFGYLEANGEVGEDGDDLVLYNDACAAAPVVVAEQPVDEAGIDMAMVATMRQIFSENGCQLGNEQMQELLPPAGFTRENVRPVFDFLEDSGEMIKVDGILILADEICAAGQEEAPVTAAPAFESDGSPYGQFIAAVIGNGCALEVSGAEEYLAAEAGLRMDQAFRIVDEMVAEGEATLISDGSTVQIDLAYCAETGTALVMEQVSPSAYPASPEGVMIAMMRRNSCEMLMADARAQFPVAGVTIEQFHPLLDRYLTNGRMDLSDDGLTISFVGPSCYPTPGSTEISDANTDEAVAQRNAANADMEARIAEATAQQEAVVAEMMAERGEAQLENDPRAGLLAMLAANSCEVTQANAAELIAAAGLDFNTSMQMLSQMMGTGEATSPDFGQTLQVGAPLCVAAVAEPMTPREIFINMIKQNNCSITSAEFTALLVTSDLDGATAYALISELEAEGVISLPASRDVVTLSAEMCR
ncbi:MAG: hypothetical protein GQ535_04600 [Rhodobacteraceae bacterium]|nr:hypothetical protein [Paracoccaceae bacterium]